SLGKDFSGSPLARHNTIKPVTYFQFREGPEQVLSDPPWARDRTCCDTIAKSRRLRIPVRGTDPFGARCSRAAHTFAPPGAIVWPRSIRSRSIHRRTISAFARSDASRAR